MIWPDIIGFSIVIFFLLGAGFKSSKNSDEYLVASRSLGFFALLATLVMTEFNTSTLFAFSGLGYSAGPMAIGLPLIFLVGLIWYTLTVAKKWKALNGISVAQLFTKRYGIRLGRTASFLLIVAMLGFSSTYVKSVSLIFVPFGQGMPFWCLSALITICSLLVTIRGGMRSVVRSDIVSFIFKIIFLPALLIVAVTKYGMPSNLVKVFPADQIRFNPISQWNHPLLPFWYVVSLTVITMFTYICSPWYGQKIFAAKDEKTAFLATGASAVVVFILYGVVVLASSYYRLENPRLNDSDLVVPLMMASWFPPILKGVGLGVLFSASLTALTGVWTAMVAMILSDFTSKRAYSVKSQRLMTIGIAFLCWLGANLLIDDILHRLILANIPIAALSFALLAGFYWKSTTRVGAWISVLVGFFWGVGCYFYFGEGGGYTWYWAMFGIPLIFISGAGGSLLFPENKREI